MSLPTIPIPGAYMGAGPSPEQMTPYNSAQDFQSTPDQVWQASVSNSLSGGMTSKAYDAYSGTTGNNRVNGDDATKQYGINQPGYQLKWNPDEQVSLDFAKDAHDSMMAKMHNDFLLAHAPDSVASYGTKAAGDLVGNLLDPVNLGASVLLPESLLGKAANIYEGLSGAKQGASAASGMIRDLQTTWGGRTSLAVGNNSLVAAAMQPIELAGDMQTHQDYTFADAANQIIMGGLAGGVLHQLGEVSRLFSGLPKENFSGPEIGGGLISDPEGLDPDIYKSIVSGEAGGMAGSNDISPELLADSENLGHDKVASDLGLDASNPEHDQAIKDEQSRRVQEIAQKYAQGQYKLQVPKSDPVEGLPESLGQKLANKDYDGASQDITNANRKLLSESGLTDDEIAKIGDHENETKSIQSATEEFIKCIGA